MARQRASMDVVDGHRPPYQITSTANTKDYAPSFQKHRANHDGHKARQNSLAHQAIREKSMGQLGPNLLGRSSQDLRHFCRVPRPVARLLSSFVPTVQWPEQRRRLAHLLSQVIPYHSLYNLFSSFLPFFCPRSAISLLSLFVYLFCASFALVIPGLPPPNNVPVLIVLHPRAQPAPDSRYCGPSHLNLTSLPPSASPPIVLSLRSCTYRPTLALRTPVISALRFVFAINEGE
ncbi:hypothetical protein BDW69DRAFT_151589 [Aspergillus filifer]